ncbi:MULTISPECIES: efflux RND transporter permease subunit [unclassified Bacillus (in: firmicutes)]|uniref:efflux RND transporter permease subunit n=1 Tax=unclassified Bacillus (in: firmicutes) TaxID=185979 RepID=UPI0008EA97AC|nr:MULTISPECIES: efflux RND transporter permease subunit [unclassified Bacillus (in: firmicutes)]SFA77071.1 hydrophobic/amphiphilic exporter-1, HAE1 family [Bacillus sp. UNCCL13]SFQ66962.1 hydrophobic/amphiphilic exporter-1, HAE1 family [Bacillus sp. cl95]
MGFLTRFSLKNAFAVFIISFLLILGGLFSFSKLKVDLLPNIEFPQLSIEVVYPGASPQDINEQVTEKLETKLKGIEGVKKMQSSSFESIAIISLEFPFNTKMDDIEQQVNSYIKDAGLPDNVQTKVNRFSFGAFPIYNISLFSKGDTDLQELLDNEVIPELNKISGVNSISVGGNTEELLQITVDKEKAAKLGLSLNDVKEQINQKQLSFPAGNLNSNEIQIPIRVQEKVDAINELENLTIKSSFNPNAPAISLKEFAKIEEISEKPEITRYNLKDSLSMAVTKKQDANTVEVADKVLSVLKKYDDRLEYAIGFDSAEGIEKSVETLIKEGLLGALFASLAVLLFLRNFRATIIAIISIPMSLLVSSIFLQQMDISLNIMTLGGMAVAVGRVVDDSIVVIENIFRRVRRTKKGISNDLIQDSTKEILKAITSSTITTVVVFLPLGFVGGVTGEFFLPFALTIVFSLLTSLVVAITIVPVLAKFSFKKVPAEEKEDGMQRFYGRAIGWSLNHKKTIIVLSILSLVGSLALVPRLGFTFIPNEEQKLLVASVQLPSSTSLEKTNEVSLELEEMFDKKKEIKEVTTGVGTRDFQTGLQRKNQANYFITLSDNVDVTELIDDLEKQMEDIVLTDAPKSKIGVQEMSTGGPPSNNNVNIDLYASDLADLQQAASDVEKFMTKQEDLKYVSNNFSERQKQVVVDIDSQKAAQLSVSGFQILGTIADQTKPVNIGNLKLDDVDRKVQISYDNPAEDLEDLKDIVLFTAKGPVPITEVAKIEETETYTAIQKLDGKVYARISAQIDSENIQKTTADVIDGVKKLDLPKGVTFEGGGGSDETMETFQQLGLAMVIAIGLVYLTMLITFGRARIPFIILSSLIFVPIGSLLGLTFAGEPMSVSVMIGMLMLIGIVTTNAIVLVDRIGQNREEKGMKIREALIEGGKTRLRPILMTAFATIAALLPLAFTTSSGTLISKGLAITVIGGLTSSTILTLILVPVIYELFFFKQVRKERAL